MPRPFTAADVVQSPATGNPVNTATPGIALPAGAAEGHCGVAVIGAGTVLDPPEQWHKVAGCGQTAGNDQLGIMVRAWLPPGDQSWAFTANAGGAATWLWLAEEWANVNGAPLAVPGTRQTSSLAPASYAIGPTDTAPAAAYVAELAAVLLLNTASSSTAWPSVSWSGGLVEHPSSPLTMGTGVWSGAVDLRLHIARRFSTSAEAGPWDTTATFSGPGSTAGKLVFGALAVLRAEALAGDV